MCKDARRSGRDRSCSSGTELTSRRRSVFPLSLHTIFSAYVSSPAHLKRTRTTYHLMHISPHTTVTSYLLLHSRLLVDDRLLLSTPHLVLQVDLLHSALIHVLQEGPPGSSFGLCPRASRRDPRARRILHPWLPPFPEEIRSTLHRMHDDAASCSMRVPYARMYASVPGRTVRVTRTVRLGTDACTYVPNATTASNVPLRLSAAFVPSSRLIHPAHPQQGTTSNSSLSPPWGGH